ncbi:MAG: oligoendopeptidase F [Bacteroidetes bacterium]|nr:oligoendopeptidase F [Bacteroidota bacterium]
MNDQSSNKGKLPSREEIDPQYTWKLEDLYSSDQEWEEDFHAVERMIAEIAGFRGKLGESGDLLLRWLHFADDLNIITGKLGNYAFRRYDENTANTRYQGLMDRVLSQHARTSAATSWVVPEILAIPRDRIDGFIAETDGLEMYAHHLDEILRMQLHTRTSSEEELLALSLEAMAGPSNIFNMFNDADIRFGTITDEDGSEIEVTKGRYIQLQESRDRRIREDSYRALYSQYATWKNTLAATLSGQVKKEMFFARARKYRDTRHMALYEDNIPESVYDNVVRTVNNNLGPLQRSVRLRREILGIDAVRPWDLYVPLVARANIHFSWDEAVQIVQDAMHVLGPAYSRDLTSALEEGWIDVYENQGKASGAYSAWTYGAHPFVLLNYTNTLKDVFTLAHEMGHAMHSYYTWKNQPPVYGGYTIFCAEVASTCNEMLLVDHMLQTRTDRELQLQLLFHFIDTIRGTVYNQALFAEFEQFMHQSAERGVPLTVDLLSETMAELYARYMGTDFGIDPLYAINWARIPHFYRSFYVFQYATGLSAAVALTRSILDRKEGALERYLDFLKSGSAKYSIDLLKDAGVDMTQPEPIAATAALMDELLDRVEDLL